MRRRIRGLGLCAAAAVVGALLSAAAPASAAPAASAAAGSWGGYQTFPANRTVDTAAYDRGVWSYTDRWGDDTGANTDGKHREDYYPLPMETYDAFGLHRTATNGDYVLPNDDARQPELSSDIVFVQLRPGASGLDVRVVLNSLGQQDSTILSLALNTTGGSGSSQFPRNAKLACTGCGVDRYVTVWGSGSEIADASGAAVGSVQNLAVDLTENTISFTVPSAALGRLGSSLGVWLAAGVHDGTGQYATVQQVCTGTAPCARNGTLPPSATNVFDLAFVHEDRTTLDERVQADLLATGQAGPARATVNLSDLTHGARRVEGEPTSGPVERVLVSALNEGDGIDTGNGAGTFQNQTVGQNFHYLGRLQPYLVNLPTGYRPGVPSPMVVVLHGYNGSYDEQYFLAPQLRDAMAAHGYLAVYPLGRGDVQYEHDGELDVLEAQRAAAAAYPTDATQVQVAGISMGGFGTTKMTTRHPDVFASGGVAVGGEQNVVEVDNDQLTSYPITRFLTPGVERNLQDTPMFLAAGGEDADTAGATATAFYELLRQVGDEAHLKTYLERSHEEEVLDYSTPQLLAMWQHSRVDPVPPRVSYTFDTSWSFPPLVDDGAYWLGGLQPRSATQATATAEALTLPRQLTTLSESFSTGGSTLDRSDYTLRDLLRQVTGQRPTSNTLTLGLTDIGRGQVDLSGLQVSTGRRYCVDVTSDGSSTVVLSGADFRGHTLAGAPGTVSSSAVTFTVPAGTTHVVLAPRGVPPTPGLPCP